jgi:hypothetical protein
MQSAGVVPVDPSHDAFASGLYLRVVGLRGDCSFRHTCILVSKVRSLGHFRGVSRERVLLWGRRTAKYHVCACRGRRVRSLIVGRADVLEHLCRLLRGTFPKSELHLLTVCVLVVVGIGRAAGSWVGYVLGDFVDALGEVAYGVANLLTGVANRLS